MPIYEYRIHTPDGIATDSVIEHICSWKNKPAKLVHPDGSFALPLVSMPAKTPGGWHGNWSEGLSSNTYSQALGRPVANKWEEAKAMRAKGFIAESDLGKDWVANTQEKLANRWQAQADYSHKYQENLKTMSPEDAVAATWTAEDCLNGKVDEVYSQEIKGV
jgi:hypothetical protein